MLLASLRARVIKRGALNFRNYADLASRYEERDWRSRGTWNRVQRMPSGPAAVITPWNAPFMLSTWKIAPALAAGHHDDPQIHELVRSRSRDRSVSEIWKGEAELELFDAPGEEHALLRPVKVGRGYRFTFAYTVDDLRTVKEL